MIGDCCFKEDETHRLMREAAKVFSRHEQISKQQVTDPLRQTIGRLYGFCLGCLYWTPAEYMVPWGDYCEICAPEHDNGRFIRINVEIHP